MYGSFDGRGKHRYNILVTVLLVIYYIIERIYDENQYRHMFIFSSS